MADIWSRAKRSSVMALVKSDGNRSTEVRLVTLLRANHVSGWRRRQPLPGRPDFVFRNVRVAVFVDGCFWHGCRRCYRRPKSNRAYWDAKVARNRIRDREIGRTLGALGWVVVRIWDHELAEGDRVIRKLLRRINTARGERKS